MDGNGRWASKKKYTKKTGHKAGIENCIKLCESLDKLKYQIDEISFFVFSTENWKRSSYEVKNLFELIHIYHARFSETADLYNLKIRHYGSRQKLSTRLLNIIDDVTEKSKLNTGTCINLLFNYGSRNEIHEAIKKIKSSNKKKFKLRDYLYTSKSLDPDLIIRTGGEKRLSNFLLWQSAYTELYFTNILWPDFKYYHLNKVIDNYLNRVRKYGKA